MSLTNKLKELKDKRLAKRYRMEVATDISVRSMAGSRPFPLKTGNISKGGVYVVCQTTTPFSVQSMVEVTLYLAGESGEEGTEIKFLGKVVHLRAKIGFGVKIVQIDASEQEKLDRFVDAYLAAHPEVLET